MTTYSVNAFIGIFGRSPQSLDSLRVLVEDRPDGLARAGEWLKTDCQYILVWRAADHRGALLFSDNEEQLLTESLWQLMEIDDQPEDTLLGCFTYTPVDQLAREAWRARGGAVPSEDRPLVIGDMRIGP